MIQTLKDSTTHQWNLFFVALAAFESNIGLLQVLLPATTYATVKLIFVMAYPTIMAWKRQTTVGPVGHKRQRSTLTIYFIYGCLALIAAAAITYIVKGVMS